MEINWKLGQEPKPKQGLASPSKIDTLFLIFKDTSKIFSYLLSCIILFYSILFYSILLCVTTD